MSIVDLEDRWIYKGGKTFPPCDGIVYWNVVRRIYPMKIEEFTKYKAKMQKYEHLIGNTGNNRRI